MSERRPNTRTLPGVAVLGDEPVAGFYLARLRPRDREDGTRELRSTPPSPVRIWFGPPPDPLTGETLDRSPRWNVEINGRVASPRGELLDVWSVWPWCGRSPIDRAEYRYRVELHRHAVEHEPMLPQAAPRSPVDWLRSAPPVFRPQPKRRRR